MEPNMLAPIPGMSLTKEPRNQPWEQPPKFVKKEEALAFYFERLNDPEKLDDTLFLLERKFPLENLVDSMTSFGVMEGYHTPDVKNLISPLIHEHLKILCESLGIEIVEWAGPTDEERQSEKSKERVKILVEEALNNPTPPSMDMVKESTEALEGDKQPLIKRRGK
jgi:hypothetical protein